MDRFVWIYVVITAYWLTKWCGGVGPACKKIIATSMVIDEFLFKPYELSYVLWTVFRLVSKKGQLQCWTGNEYEVDSWREL